MSTMKRSILFIGLLVACAGAMGQGVKKKITPAAAKSTTNVEIIAENDSVSDSLGLDPADTTTSTRYFLFPQFYSYWPVNKNDTILKYQCYDAENSYINVDTLQDVNLIQHIQFVKVFTNFLHTYIDAEGKPRASAATKIIYRYDKTDDGMWKAFDCLNNYSSEIREFRKEIVRQDTTTVINPRSGGRQTTIRRYYRVEEQKKEGEIEQEKEKDIEKKDEK